MLNKKQQLIWGVTAVKVRYLSYLSRHYLLSASHIALCLWFTQTTVNVLYICEEVNDIRPSIHGDCKSGGKKKGYYISEAVKSVVPPGWFCQLYLLWVKLLMPGTLERPWECWRVNSSRVVNCTTHLTLNRVSPAYACLWINPAALKRARQRNKDKRRRKEGKTGPMPSVTASSFSPSAACQRDTVLPVVNFNWPSGESTNHWLEINQQINPGIIHISHWTRSRSRLGQSSLGCRRTRVGCHYCLTADCHAGEHLPRALKFPSVWPC